MSASSTDSQQTTSLPLKGGWLILSRLLWVLVALISVGALLQFLSYASEYLQNVGDWRRAALYMMGGIVTPQFYRGYYLTLIVIFAAIYMGVGAFIIWRKSDDRMALLISLMLVSFGVTGASAIHFAALVNGLSGNAPFTTLLMISAIIGNFLFFTSFYIFPDGRFVPGWTRWVMVAVVIYIVFAMLPEGSALHLNTLSPFLNTILPFVFFGVAVYAQIYRYRRVATPQQRQQTKWLVYGLGFSTTLIFIFSYLIPALVPEIRPPTIPAAALGYEMFSHLIFMSLTVVPLAIGFSVLRYRLWDIDYIINRSLVYGGVSALIIITFGAVLYIVSVITRQYTIALLLGAVAAGALFQPVRRWLQRLVDQRLYNIQIEYRAPKAANPTQTLKKTNLGGYRDLQIIGKGGMGEVYKAEHPSLERTVAIKLLPTALTEDEQVQKRFQREAETLARLQHPNIVRIFDYGDEGGTRYMAMEYIKGQDLGAYLKQQQRLPLAQALPLLKQIASALDYAHAQGLVHRDIKPSNILLESGDSGYRAVLTDFGIAKILGAQTRLTRSGIIGTLDYIAPEQIQEKPDIDGRVDIYALGIMAYQMLTGELPFKQQNAGALLIAHLTQPAPDAREVVPDLPRETAHALHKAMAKQPSERYATASEFVDELAKS